MNDLSARLREAAAKALPDGAFLRRDRGTALFVTDAPRRRPDIAWAQRLSAAGFACREANGLLLLTPGPAWVERLEAAFPEPPDFLCQTLLRFAGRPPDAAGLVLFALGARALDGGGGFPDFDRRLRQRAAAALRTNDTDAGGGLYACGLLRTLIIDKGGTST